MSGFDPNTGRLRRLGSRAWPTVWETRDLFAGLRTQWLVPYRDRRAPIPHQHAAPQMLATVVQPLPVAAKRGLRPAHNFPWGYAVDEALKARAIRDANRRDAAVVAFREAARVAWAPRRVPRR